LSVLLSVFMHVPPPVCFVPTTLAIGVLCRECKRCVAHRFLLFLGGAWVLCLSGIGDLLAVVGAASGRCDGGNEDGDFMGQQSIRQGARREALDTRS